MTPTNSSRFDPSVLKQINSRIEQDPDRIAIRTPYKCVSYRQLDDLSNRIASDLVNIGEIETRPLVVLSSDPAILAGVLLTCLRSGAIYAPVDPEQPVARVREIAMGLDAIALITDSSQVSLVQGLADLRIPVTTVDRLEVDQPKSVIQTSLTTSRLLWIMHTSGSMGKPKGVMQTEVNIARYIWQVTNALKLVASDRMSLAASLNSHAGAVMCLAVLCNGATFCPLDLRRISLEEVADFLAMHHITLFFTVPGILSALGGLGMIRNRCFPALRLIRLSGETVARGDIENCWSMFPELEWVSVGYGTTETGGISQHFFKRGESLPSNPLPVGRKVPGVEIRIVNEHGSQVKVDEDGEIVVVSRFFSPGYWKNPPSTRAAFRRLDNGFRLYATGDVGHHQSDGVLVHKGRYDLQFKRLGNRVEPREIELALAKIPTITEAVVRPLPNTNGVSLVAYLVAKNGRMPKENQIRQQLIKLLPSYMIPNHLVQLDSIPRTRMGKVAYEELPLPSSTPPITETSTQIYPSSSKGPGDDS